MSSVHISRHHTIAYAIINRSLDAFFNQRTKCWESIPLTRGSLGIGFPLGIGGIFVSLHAAERAMEWVVDPMLDQGIKLLSFPVDAKNQTVQELDQESLRIRMNIPPSLGLGDLPRKVQDAILTYENAHQDIQQAFEEMLDEDFLESSTVYPETNSSIPDELTINEALDNLDVVVGAVLRMQKALKRARKFARKQLKKAQRA